MLTCLSLGHAMCVRRGKGRAMYVCVVEPCVNGCVGVRAMCKCVVIVHLSVVSRTRKV